MIDSDVHSCSPLARRVYSLTVVLRYPDKPEVFPITCTLSRALVDVWDVGLPPVPLLSYDIYSALTISIFEFLASEWCGV